VVRIDLRLHLHLHRRLELRRLIDDLEAVFVDRRFVRLFECLFIDQNLIIKDVLIWILELNLVPKALTRPTPRCSYIAVLRRH
jgi:hypothetical protein